MQIEPNREAEFRGLFSNHWEAGGIYIEVGRRFFGLLARREYWEAAFPSDFEYDYEDIGRRFHIRFVGVPSERGEFGHMGMCCRRVEVRRVIEFSEIR
jgi:hypothetical protein